MKFSEMWIREWINPPINSAELINQLTMAGFKVNQSNIVSNIFDNIIIGEIIKYIIHPKFNTYQIITINIGNKKSFNVIHNIFFQCKKNMKVVVATSGALLPNGIQIKSKIIYGKLSEGILCSWSMLQPTYSNNYQNDIIELPNDAPIGQEFYDYLHFNDTIIDIHVTPNRGDCLSIIGIAREISVINQKKIKKPHIDIINPSITDQLSVVIKNPITCPKFLGRVLKNLNSSIKTPIWIKEKLNRSGIFLVNVITDIINYVLIELGHPIYAYDYEKINGNTLYIHYINNKKTFISSENNKNIQLFSNTLIISDQQQILSIAGCIIEKKFIVNSQTRNIFLQSACFNAKIISNQSKLYNIHNLSSIRYIRGIDSNISQLALDRVTSLLLCICNGNAGPKTMVINQNMLPIVKTIIIHRKKLDKILGFHIIDQDVINILQKLGFKDIEILHGIWKVKPPSWRFDISIEENVISEIIRIYGYNNIPQTPIKINLQKIHLKKSTISLTRIKSLLVDLGYQEAITYSFVHPNIQKLLYPTQTPLTLINPITINMSVMRTSLLSSLITAIIYNHKRQQTHIRLFESGICFPTQNNFINNKIQQKFMIAGMRSGLRFHTHWDLSKDLVDFYDIKGDVETILRITNKSNNVTFKPYIKHTALHPGQSASVYLYDQCIGYIGMLHPKIQTALNLKSHILVFELSWDILSKYVFPKITKISKFPKNFRDISVIIPNNISANSIISACKNFANNDVINIKLSDVYIGKNIPKNYKSFTIKFLLQSNTHTLKEKEISNIIQQYTKYLQEHFHAIIR